MMLPFNPKSGLIIVPLKLFGQNGEMITRFALDTGATESIVNRAVAVSLGYDESVQSKKIQLTTASGDSNVIEITVTRIEVLGQARENVLMLCSVFPYRMVVDGILGLDFLRGQRLTLDFRSGLLSLD